MLDKIIKVIMNNNKKYDVNNYHSNYGADKNHVSIKNDNQCKYHVIYSINKNNIPSLKWTYFKLSKFIFSNRLGFLCNYKGMYSLN
jgi:hypothetical protein